MVLERMYCSCARKAFSSINMYNVEVLQHQSADMSSSITCVSLNNRTVFNILVCTYVCS